MRHAAQLPGWHQAAPIDEGFFIEAPLKPNSGPPADICNETVNTDGLRETANGSAAGASWNRQRRNRAKHTCGGGRQRPAT